MDTCIEPWAGGYIDPTLRPRAHQNYALREEVLALRQSQVTGPTAVVTHGANPGLVSQLVKQALLNIADEVELDTAVPRERNGWAELAYKLGIKTIHIAEKDAQVANVPKKPNEFLNTWSVDGFVSEGCQPAELGWGTHEKALPPRGCRHEFGSQSAIYMLQPGAVTQVRTWTPSGGPFHGFLITHGESISISDYLTVRDERGVVYRPTTHYSYHPCNDALLSLHELAGRNWKLQDHKRILRHELIGGIDELGVLLAGHARTCYWFGSQLSIDEARQLSPYKSATSLQICVAVLAGVIWAIENPDRGIFEPEETDFQRILQICTPYLGKVFGEYSEWTPLSDRNCLFQEDLNYLDPWQLSNVLV